MQTFWEDVRHEMINEKGLDSAAADRIGEYVQFKGSHCDKLILFCLYFCLVFKAVFKRVVYVSSVISEGKTIRLFFFTPNSF